MKTVATVSLLTLIAQASTVDQIKNLEDAAFGGTMEEWSAYCDRKMELTKAENNAWFAAKVSESQTWFESRAAEMDHAFDAATGNFIDGECRHVEDVVRIS